MDSESLLYEPKTTTINEKDETERQRGGPPQRTPWLEFTGLALLLVTCASLGAYFCHQQAVSSIPIKGELYIFQDDDDNSNSMEAWNVGKKFHPPHPKKLHHGEVLYTTVQDSDVGRYYKREFRIPCGYGLLVFNIGPADQGMPYYFDVYDDGYVYSDNGGLCWLYPSYRAHQNDTEPFWNPSDPTSFHVPLSKEPLDMTKISTRINEHPHTKSTDNDKMQDKGGDYLVMAKHNFYTPHYYRALKSVVNAWKSEDVETMTTQDLDTMVQQAMEEAFLAPQEPDAY